ncbi:hypothetical protein LP419_35530 [Massilia sp. H-1]|nr:hypothetical protein LP419_35530 [Massilia sp. H-1]
MSHRLRHAALCATLMLATVSASATNVMNMEAEQLVRAGSFVRESLALTPNQETLFQQVSGKSAAILRAPEPRRERLQADLRTRLADPRQELRDLSAGIDQEAASAAAEDRQLRELWLTLTDALTDQQRVAASQFLLTQLEAWTPLRAPQGERPQGERGEHGQRPGGKGRPGSHGRRLLGGYAQREAGGKALRQAAVDGGDL